MNRTWTYIIGKQLSDTELEQLEHAGKTFVQHWTAHENKLTATFSIFGKRIIIVKVNEDVNGASGCSIDKLTRFVKVSETMFGVELLNRLLVAYDKDGSIEVAPASQIKQMLESGSISGETTVYNTSASNEQELAHWKQPLKDTWLSKYL